MKAKRVAAGIYRREEDGTLYERPRLTGKRTWRRLWSLTLTQARQEIAARRSDHHRAALGLAEDPYQASPSIQQILDTYAQAGFPSTHGRRRAQRTQIDESRRLDRLGKAFGAIKARELTAARLRTFGARRPARAAQLDCYTLKNAIKHAVATGNLSADPVAVWPQFHSDQPARRSREAAPATGDELHALAQALFASRINEPYGWWLLLLALTGCRRSEVLELRLDASAGEPGHVEGQWLWLNRKKGGINPFALITPELSACIEAHHRWHTLRYPGHPYWIPHRNDKTAHAPADALGKAMNRATAKLQLPRRTPHGLRAFYVTLRRSQGISDAQIAAEIGDATGAAIVAQVYGAVPPNWQGGKELAWLPSQGEPAWNYAFSPNVSPARKHQAASFSPKVRSTLPQTE